MPPLQSNENVFFAFSNLYQKIRGQAFTVTSNPLLPLGDKVAIRSLRAQAGARKRPQHECETLSGTP